MHIQLPFGIEINYAGSKSREARRDRNNNDDAPPPYVPPGGAALPPGVSAAEQVVTLFLFTCEDEPPAAEYRHSGRQYWYPRGFGWKIPGSTETYFFGPDIKQDLKRKGKMFARLHAGRALPLYPRDDCLGRAGLIHGDTYASRVRLHDMIATPIGEITRAQAERLEVAVHAMHDSYRDGGLIPEVSWREWSIMVATLVVQHGILPEEAVDIVKRGAKVEAKTPTVKPDPEPLAFVYPECHLGCGPSEHPKFWSSGNAH